MTDCSLVRSAKGWAVLTRSAMPQISGDDERTRPWTATRNKLAHGNHGMRAKITSEGGIEQVKSPSPSHSNASGTRRVVRFTGLLYVHFPVVGDGGDGTQTRRRWYSGLSSFAT